MRRNDVLDLLIGKGNYVDDIPYKGYFGVFVRSPYPHARILKIDAEEVVRKGGLVFTAKDLYFNKGEKEENEGTALLTLPLAFKKVRYEGEPIALVIAEDPYKAQDLAELVSIDYEVLQPVSSVEEALKNEVLVFEELKTNVVYEKTLEYGTIPFGDKELDLDLYWSRSSGNPIETFGAIVYPDGTVYSNAQAPKFLAEEISKISGRKVKLIPVRAGGSFGSKFSLAPYISVLVQASAKFNVPIKWIETRSEHLKASNSSGPERTFKIKVYYKENGLITGLDFTVFEDIGASLYNGQAFKPSGILAGPYKIRNIRYTAKLIATNKNPPGAFRGAGTPPHTWALERIMDTLAEELGISKSEIRKKNFIDNFPYEAPYTLYDSGDPNRLLSLALERTDLWNLREKGYGIGLACSTDPSTPSGTEGVKIEVRNGKVVVKVGYSPEGQGNEHTAVKLVSQFLGIPEELVTVETIDSDSSPPSFGPGGSRMAVFMAGAIKGAVEELVKVISQRIRREYGEEVEFSNGYFIAKNGDKFHISKFEGTEVTYTFNHQGKYRFTAYPFACDIAVVKVDRETGLIKPVKLVVYIDPGTPIDEELVKEQVIGGSAIGVSLALYEAYKYGKQGELLTTSLIDYGLPSALDLPEFEINIVPTPSPYTPLGAKGVGEIPVGVAAAAITSAVEDLTGKKIRSVPIDKEILYTG
ncbi:xanthine dehydrogenase family protein molybdopterin-binding subunit [Stygiolobus azoricus]|uniref:Molybdopterin-dependent oxidoreductase n=1 Tax=Stygiolobus azoricus TaxID=41675 RepID=A0A650CR90_9CREN|nr:xanthine dehydrogenase family protein molybdopterin-binding subunit [Stygiolobus azoricus]QGR19997.1 molybdopterin-dependent oxidoreductase [Stygiolobus azoricus]